MHLIVLHGTAGFWDEVACLAIPATVILGVALVVLREKPQPDDALAIDTVAAHTDEVSATNERIAHGEQP